MSKRVINSGTPGLEENLEGKKKCRARGHPAEQEILVPYIGNDSRVLEKCLGCSTLHLRFPTGSEIMAYRQSKRLEHTYGLKRDN